MSRRKGRKNPAPQRVSQGDGDDGVSEIFPSPILNLPDDPDEMLKILRQTPITSLYQENELNAWESIVRTSDGIIECPRCGRKYTTWKGLHYHVTVACPKFCRHKYTCLICGKGFQEVEEIKAHVSVLHVRPEAYEMSSRIRKSAANASRNFVSDDDMCTDGEQFADESVQSSDSGADDDFVAEDDDEAANDYPARDKKVPRSRSKKNRKKSAGKRGVKLGTSLFSFAKLEEPLGEAIAWVHEFLSGLEDEVEDVLPDVMPNPLGYKTLLSLDDFMFCGGQVAPSPAFAIEREVMGKKSTVGLNTECAKLDAFTSLPAANTHKRHDLTFCAAGPVWAMAWCPTPLKNHGSKQYLALSTHSDMHSVSRCYSEAGIIQIWNCGRLSIHGHQNEPPELAIGLSHYDAPVWELKWCPFGGRRKSKEKLNRIGILAAACGSGKVLIIAVPDPEKLNIKKLSDSPKKLPIFKAKPGLILLPSARFSETDGEHCVDRAFGQCVSLDWSLSDECQWLAGGYASGIVALWKIHDPSPFLLQESEFDPPTLVACRSFRAHSKAVRGLAWCPFKGNVLATGGMDRFLRVWDRDSPEAPINEANWKGSTYLGLHWPLLWCGIYAATEDAFSGPSYHGVLYHDALQDYLAPVAVIPFKSTCWSVTSSHWMNLVAGSDPTGQVVVHACSNWSRRTQGKKFVPRIQLFSTSVRTDSGNGIDRVDYVPQESHADKNGVAHTDTSGDESQDSAKVQNGAGYKLIFKDTNMTDLSRAEKRNACKNVKVYDNFPPTLCEKTLLQSVNRIQWNPNFGSHTWIASGTQSGLVRLHCVDIMHSENIDEMYCEFVA